MELQVELSSNPYASDTQIPGPNNPVTWNAPNPKHKSPDNNK